MGWCSEISLFKRCRMDREYPDQPSLSMSIPDWRLFCNIDSSGTSRWRNQHWQVISVDNGERPTFFPRRGLDKWLSIWTDSIITGRTWKDSAWVFSLRILRKSTTHTFAILILPRHDHPSMWMWGWISSYISSTNQLYHISSTGIMHDIDVKTQL